MSWCGIPCGFSLDCFPLHLPSHHNIQECQEEFRPPGLGMFGTGMLEGTAHLWWAESTPLHHGKEILHGTPLALQSKSISRCQWEGLESETDIWGSLASFVWEEPAGSLSAFPSCTSLTVLRQGCNLSTPKWQEAGSSQFFKARTEIVLKCWEKCKNVFPKVRSRSL